MAVAHSARDMARLAQWRNLCHLWLSGQLNGQRSGEMRNRLIGEKRRHGGENGGVAGLSPSLYVWLCNGPEVWRKCQRLTKIRRQSGYNG
jgi:hypothetical protein